ncbi:hypothetical protein [Catenuloplanes indicus]|uniref:Uncharacterized protein n=1 Tax=Catenuloplanes indicus TaxID=137267 RepID=A0AAE4B4K9_9ACTN|nr:hypothetical protein [Catenuloplanes indicus]MDQ0371568.1 hypothetical protein [Catenuloplanes indicus]
MPAVRGLNVVVRPGPNAILPCGTDSARRRHLARGKRCKTCWPTYLGLPPMPDVDYFTALGLRARRAR